MRCLHHGCKLVRQRELRAVYQRTGRVRDLMDAIFCMDTTVECRKYRVEETGELVLNDDEVIPTTPKEYR